MSKLLQERDWQDCRYFHQTTVKNRRVQKVLIPCNSLENCLLLQDIDYLQNIWSFRLIFNFFSTIQVILYIKWKLFFSFTVLPEKVYPHSDMFSQYVRFYKTFSFTKCNLNIFDYFLNFCFSHIFNRSFIINENSFWFTFWTM